MPTPTEPNEATPDVWQRSYVPGVSEIIPLIIMSRGNLVPQETFTLVETRFRAR
jgi:hypothetical protein